MAPKQRRHTSPGKTDSAMIAGAPRRLRDPRAACQPSSTTAPLERIIHKLDAHTSNNADTSRKLIKTRESRLVYYDEHEQLFFPTRVTNATLDITAAAASSNSIQHAHRSVLARQREGDLPDPFT